MRSLQPKKILVINLMHIGDLLLVTPILRTLRTQFPQAHIALLADKKLQDLVKNNQNINELITIDKKGQDDGFWPYLRFAWKLRQCRFDWVINLHQNERASFLAAFSGAKTIVGYATAVLRHCFTKYMLNRKAEKHQIESHFDVLSELLGLPERDDQGLEIWLDAGAKEDGAVIWQREVRHERPVVGLNIGASWPTKRWRHEHFAKLAERLIERGYGIAFFGGPMDEELVEETRALMKPAVQESVSVFTGKLSLMQLAAVLPFCRVLVTNDSGPMHVAVAMGVPLVTMFGASPVPGFYPYSNTSVLIQSSEPCHPCGSHHCEHHSCMWKISVEQVEKETLRLLEASTEELASDRAKLGPHECRIIR